MSPNVELFKISEKLDQVVGSAQITLCSYAVVTHIYSRGHTNQSHCLEYVLNARLRLFTLLRNSTTTLERLAYVVMVGSCVF